MVYSATSGSAVLGHGNPQGTSSGRRSSPLFGLVALFVLSRLRLEKLRALAPTLLVDAAVLCLGVLASGGASTARAAGSTSGRSRSSRPSSRSSRSSSGSPRISPAAPAPRTLDELAKPVGLRRARLRRARALRARPRDGARDHARRRRDPPCLGHAMSLLATAYGDRHRARRDRCVVVAVPPRPPAHVPRPVEGSDRRRPAERPGAHQPRLGRHLRRRPRARHRDSSTISPRHRPT